MIGSTGSGFFRMDRPISIHVVCATRTYSTCSTTMRYHTRTCILLPSGIWTELQTSALIMQLYSLKLELCEAPFKCETQTSNSASECVSMLWFCGSNLNTSLGILKILWTIHLNYRFYKNIKILNSCFGSLWLERWTYFSSTKMVALSFD